MSQKKDKNDKGDKRRNSRERPVEVSDYLPLEESESSESERLATPPGRRPANEGMEPPPSTSAGTSKGAGVKLPRSLNLAAVSYQPLTVADIKGACPSQSTDKGTFMPSFNPAGKSKASGRNKSPLKALTGRGKSPSRPRSESTSQLKKIQERQTRTRKAEEKKSLLDHPDGELDVAVKSKPPVEFKYTGEKLSTKDACDREPEPTDDDTSKSSVSDASSVSRATRDLIIDRDDDESKEPQATGMTLRSSLRVRLPPESPGDSDKESKSSGDSDKETKSKRKKK